MLPLTATVDISKYSSSLDLGEDGLWRAQRTEPVSYPGTGNQGCHAIEDASFWFRHRNRCILALLDRIKPEGPVFDIGGGNGYVSSALASAGLDVVVVEPGIDGARAAKARGLNAVICATLNTAGFVPASLPAVGLFDVVEHVEDDQRFLATVHELLEPGGWVILTVPAHRWLWSHEDVDAGHFRRYTRASIVAALAGAGFDVPFAGYIFRWLPLPILLLRALPSALGLRRQVEPGRSRAEHQGGSGGVRKWVDRSLAGEVTAIRSGRPCRVGASVLVAARKPPLLPSESDR